MKRFSCLLVPAVAVGVFAGLAPADPAADPLAITPEAGAWVICAGSYMGEEASGLAHQLAEQLRTRHNLPAYIFDRGDDELKQYQEEHRRREAALGPDIHLPFRHPRVTSQFAVLIGGFADIDSANAALAKVKKLPQPDLKLRNGADAFDTEYGIIPDASKKSANLVPVKVNPLARAFVTRNPTVPHEAPGPAKPDPIWKELNAGEAYSLLKNPKPWTLVVKQYTGSVGIQQNNNETSFLKKLGQMGRNPGDVITAAGLQAHHLAEFLRDKRIGFDAYVLHTRNSSIVTVGGFDSPDDPELIRMRQRLERLKFNTAPGATAARGDPIGLFAHPLPMEVPRF